MFKLKHCQPIFGNLFIKHQNKGFFLKYLRKQGIIKVDENSSILKKNESVDFKDLLDESKIKITYYDIAKDYYNFTDSYYYYKPKYQVDPRFPEKVETKLPFDSKSMTLGKVLLHALIPSRDRPHIIMLYYLVIFYLLGFLLYLNMNSIYKKSDKIMAKFQVNSYDEDVIQEKKSYENKSKGFFKEK